MSTKVQAHDQAALRESILGVISHLQTHPEQTEARFSAASSLSEGFRSDISIRDFSIVSDEPESLGGTNQGPNPVELVLGALGACQEIVIKAYASVLGIEVQSVSVEAHGDLNLKGFFALDDHVRPGFEHVSFTTVIHTKETNEQKKEQLRYYAEKHCPVIDIIKNNVPTKGTLLFQA